eukprot:scaffold13030_cov35-Phaeocystis_antarctica.AAC.1
MLHEFQVLSIRRSDVLQIRIITLQFREQLLLTSELLSSRLVLSQKPVEQAHLRHQLLTRAERSSEREPPGQTSRGGIQPTIGLTCLRGDRFTRVRARAIFTPGL